MKLRSCVLLAFAFANLHLAVGDFTIDYLGDSAQNDEFNNQSICWTKVCMRDSDRLIYSASHDLVNPCDDFSAFAMGEFRKHRVPSERYAKLGFQNEIDTQYLDKQKRVLQGSSDADAPTVIKVVKNLFKKCIDSSKFCYWLVFKMQFETNSRNNEEIFVRDVQNVFQIITFFPFYRSNHKKWRFGNG